MNRLRSMLERAMKPPAPPVSTCRNGHDKALYYVVRKRTGSKTGYQWHCTECTRASHKRYEEKQT